MRRNKNQQSVLKRQFLKSFLYLIAITEILLSIVLFWFYGSSQLKTVKSFTINQLKQASGSGDILYEQMLAVQNTVFTNSDIYTAMSSVQTDYIHEAAAVRNLRSIQSSHAYIQSIGIYNPYTDRYLTTSGVYEDNQDEIEQLNDLLGTSQVVSLPRSVYVSSYKNKAKQVYSFIFRINSKMDGLEETLMNIDIDKDYLHSLIQNVADSTHQRSVTVFDEENRIISHTNSTFFMMNMDMMPYAEKISEQTAERGAFNYNDEGLWQLTYVRSPTTGWLFVCIQPRNTIVSSLLVFAIITVIALVLLFLLGALLSAKQTKKLHFPIQKLYNSYAGQMQVKDGMADSSHINELLVLDQQFARLLSSQSSLKSELSMVQGMAKYTYIRYLLDGGSAGSKPDVTFDERFEENLNAAAFLPVLMEYDEFSQRDTNKADMLLYQYALENICSEILSNGQEMDFLYLGGNQFAALLYLAEPAVPGGLDDLLEQVITIMDREFQMLITCCIGMPVTSKEEIGYSFRRILVSMKLRMACDYQKVLFASEVCNGMRTKHNRKRYESKLAEALREQDIEQAYHMAEQMIDSLSEISWSYAQSYCKHILLSLVGKFELLLASGDEELTQLLNLVERIDTCQTLDSILQVSILCLDSLHACIRERRNSNSRDIIRQVEDYMKKNFHDPNLSMNVLAEVVELSPSYLGKMISSHMAMSFTEYLHKLRVQHAAGLLTETTMPVAHIAKKVGILNTNYFYSIFKKEYGTTPSSYRKKQKGK